MIMYNKYNKQPLLLIGTNFKQGTALNDIRYLRSCVLIGTSYNKGRRILRFDFDSDQES